MQYVIWKINSDGVGTITLNRPEKRNALNEQLVIELKEVLDLARTDNSCKIVVIESSGEAFCAGADLEYLQKLQKNSFEENVQDSTNLMELFKTIYTFPKIIISKVDGPAIAGGCGLATVTDFCFASNKATFGYTEARIGFVPAIVMVFLLRKIGEGKAREILLTGEVFGADRAKHLGLVNEVIDAAELNDYVNHFAINLVSKNSGRSLALIKEMIATIPEKNLNEALTYAAQKNAEMRESEDCKKGISAFLNKEKISWR
ncbi:MAG: enoyl-CoA hydratase/isomerase family protein [Flavobacteriales bacterium]|nr:enoyl-CoA hydratase/isomerase family protein [Flavobacteriales bacterium]